MTAVEWLLVIINDEYLYKYYSKDIEQAKELEKQQIIDAIAESNKSNNRNVSLNPEQYYNETFKQL